MRVEDILGQYDGMGVVFRWEDDAEHFGRVYPLSDDPDYAYECEGAEFDDSDYADGDIDQCDDYCDALVRAVGLAGLAGFEASDELPDGFCVREYGDYIDDGTDASAWDEAWESATE